MAKLTPVEREQLEVADLHLNRFLRTFKMKLRKGKDLAHLQGLETAANLLNIMRMK
jgi:hypothetical protein